MRSNRAYANKNDRRYAARKITCLILIVIGFLASAPFFIDTFILGNSYHYIGFWLILRLIGTLFGGPMLFYGIVGMFVKRHTSASLLEMDVARIRYSVETTKGDKQ